MDTILTIAQYAAYVIAGLVVILNGIAPLTKNTWDNKLLEGLRFIEDKLLGWLLPQHIAFKKSDVVIEEIAIPEELKDEEKVLKN